MTIADSMPKPSHPIHLRKDPAMQHIEQRLREVHEHQARHREHRQAERTALAAAQAERRTVRRQVGETIIRFGHRVAGEALGAPALSR